MISLFHFGNLLHKHDPFISIHEPEVEIYAERNGVLEETSSGRSIVHHVPHVVAGLVYSQRCKIVEGARVNCFVAIRYGADSNLGVHYFMTAELKLMSVPPSTHPSPMCASFSEGIAVYYSSSPVYGPAKYDLILL